MISKNSAIHTYIREGGIPEGGIPMINKNSAIPLYDQLINILIDEIKEELNPNEKMLSERAICKKYDVSRTTTRLALQELENMGHIYRRPGKGTFVAELNHKKQNLMDNYSFTDQMHELGRNPKTKVISFETVNANRYIAGRMGLDLGENVYRLERLRLADGIPMMFETSYVPVNGFPKLTEDHISKKPLYEIFREDYNESIKIADEEFSAGLVNANEAKLLKLKEGDPCLKLKRTSYNKRNKVIELTLSTARSDQFVYKTRHNVE